MRKHHGLGFKRFAGRRLRYIVEHADRWVCLSEWQTGSFKSAPRERWIGWQPEQQWYRLHLIVNNTRFAMLDDAGRYPNMGSHVPKLICRRTSDDWQATYGHGVLLAEMFVDPARHRCTVYDAAVWQTVGQSAGYSRRGGQYTDSEQLQEVLVRYTVGRIRQLPVLAGEVKRIRGASRNCDSNYETVTLVEHGSGIPKASCSFHNSNEELGATWQLLSETDVAERVITLDALHATFESVGLIVEAQADNMLALKDKTALQLDRVKSMNWRSHRVLSH